MAMTDTRPAPQGTTAAPTMALPSDPPGLAGWLSTSDHKRIGRLWIATSLLFLLLGTVMVALLGAEGTKGGIDLFKGHRSYAQASTLQAEVLVLLFLLPMLLGLATAIVPLQVGSAEIAFPRGSATAYWLYLVSSGIYVGAYLGDGGYAGGTSRAVDLWLLSLLGVTVALTIGLVSVLTTVLGLRAPGMTLLRTPAFAWSVLVGGSLVLLSIPVLAARLIEMYVAHHFGGHLTGYGTISWFWSVPSVYLLTVPAAGVALEIVPVLTRNRVRLHAAGLAVIGLLGVVGLGMWAQVPATFDDLLYVAIGLAAVLPPLALLGLLGDTMRNGRPVFKAPLLFAFGTVLLLLLGAIAGALRVIEPLHLGGTTWETGQTHLLVLGAGTLGGLGALWYWAPKLFGVELSEGAAVLAFLVTLGGSLLLAVPELVNGLVNDLRVGTTSFTDHESSIKALNGVSAAGAVLLTLGALIVVLTLLASARRRSAASVADDPWGGHTLEWTTASPPVPANFTAPVAPVLSATPLLDEVTA